MENLFKMRFTQSWDPAQLLTWTMVFFGIIITVWQGWDCTQQYLAQPVRVEEQFVKVTDLPPIQLSICKIFSIDQPSSNAPLESQFTYYDEVSVSDEFSLSTEGTMPIFSNSSAAFWRTLDDRWEKYHLGDFIEEIGFWNDTASSWDLIYEKTKKDVSMMDMAIYPYEGNSSLLCHTLQPGLAEFGSQIRLVTTVAVDSRK